MQRIKKKSGSAKRERDAFFAALWKCICYLGGMNTAGGGGTFTLSGSGGGLGWYLLALRVVILNQVLEQVHSFLGLDLIYFDEVLQNKESCTAQPEVKSQGVFVFFLV